MNALKKGIFRAYLGMAHSGNSVIAKIGYKFGQYVAKPARHAVYERKGVKLLLNPLNMIDKAIIQNQGHDVVVEREIEEQLKNGGVFVDVGANWGYFSILASAMPAVQVLAFEPSLKELSILYEHIILNKRTNIWAYPLGLASETSVQKLYLGGDRNTGQNSLVNDHHQGYVEALFAPMSSLIPKDFISRIRLIKIDVEGYELFVLEGMKNVVAQLADCHFVIEITPQFLAKVGHSARDIYAFFGQFGYKGRNGLFEDGQYDEVFYKA
ncbi:MAG: methyltransferase FkbM family [Flavipsychrobacter sp.]|nr:methyltransferase FkbM family [Flavipsychrobacter sp.]